MHQSTVPVVLKAVDALGAGSWLTLSELARHWPGAERVAAPLKAADRLLRSPVLSRCRASIYDAMTHWLIRETRPLVVVDWSDLKADGRFKLLRAGLAVQGRTLTLWEEVHPQETAGRAAVEWAFLQALAQQLPDGCRPIVLSDAGFRRPWFRQVVALGWDYIGRVRGTVKVQPRSAPTPDADAWHTCADVHAHAMRGRSGDLGGYWLGRHTSPLPTRLIVHAPAAHGRHAVGVRGKRRRDPVSEKAARAAREPWVLATSLDPALFPATRVARYYARRMTIEQSFRDLKSGAFGAGFEHSLTHKGERLANLLVLFALAQLAAWLVGLCEQARGHGDRLASHTRPSRRHHSTLRLGWEVLRHPLWWPPPFELRRFLNHLSTRSTRCPAPLCTTVGY
jgi:hypothetical protein